MEHRALSADGVLANWRSVAQLQGSGPSIMSSQEQTAKSTPPTAWLTYAWVDNQDHQVEFLAQEIELSGVRVKLDRWSLTPGQRLWEQIADFITSPSESDGWLLYVTESSIRSQACREELAYALQRALASRGDGFPIIGLFPSQISNELLHPAITSRLYVSLTDPDWLERIRCTLQRRPLHVMRPIINPYQYELHKNGATGITFGARPRVGTWNPAFVAVPVAERELNNDVGAYFGPPGRPPMSSITHSWERISGDGEWWMMMPQGEATPTMCVFVSFKDYPSCIAFGVEGGKSHLVFRDANGITYSSRHKRKA